MSRKPPRLTTLKPRIATLDTNRGLRTISHVARLQRQTGRRGVERRARWLRENPLCVMCLAETPPRTTAATEVDHIVPLSQGGADHVSNFQSLCAEHHREKTNREIKSLGEGGVKA
jgi:5-methylcytosine-specific restriction enzyme A